MKLSRAVVAEWLRRWTRNPMGFPRAGWNPDDCDNFLIFEGAVIIRVALLSTTLAKLVAKFASGVVDTGGAPAP